MPDHEFEKKIQEKMGELKLRPSAPVWERVEQELNKKEKRRRGLVWLPFFLASVTGIYFLLHQYAFNTKHIALKETPAARHHTQLADSTKKSLTTVTPGEKKTIRQEPEPGLTDTALHFSSRQVPVGEVTAHNEKQHLPVKQVASSTQRKKAKRSDIISGETEHLNNAAASRETARINHDATPGEIKLKSLEHNLTPFSAQPPVEASERLEKDAPAASIGAPLILTYQVDMLHSVPAPLSKDSEIRKALLRKKKWEFGYAISFGRSHLNNGRLPSLFHNESVPSNRLYSNFSSPITNPAPGVPPGMAYIPPSKLKPGFAFAAGGYVKQQVSESVQLSFGLNYKFFSTSNKLGGWRDTSIISSTPNGAQFDMVTKVYATGSHNRYINRFHFIELPVTATGRFINGKVPVNWNAGLSYSRLLASNALHYDSDYRFYYKDNRLLKKNQLTLTAGLSTPILLSAAHPVQVGPELSYGLTSIIKGDNEDGKHFLFLGLKASMPIK